MEREFQDERLEVNRRRSTARWSRRWRAPRSSASFSKSGYEPDDLRQMARDGRVGQRGRGRDLPRPLGAQSPRCRQGGPVAPLVRDGGGSRRQAGRGIDSSRRSASRRRAPDRPRGASARAPRRETENEQSWPSCSCTAARNSIVAEPRLASAVEAQAVMEKHLGEAFDGDADRMTSATPREPSDDLGRAAARPWMCRCVSRRRCGRSNRPKRTPDLER